MKKTSFVSVWLVAVALLVLGSQAALVKAESLVLYHSWSREEVEPILNRFKEIYPDELTIDSFRAPGEELLTTIELELRARRPQWDVVLLNDAQIWSLNDRHDPFEPYAPEGVDQMLIPQDEQQLLIPFSMNFYVFEYNTQHISEEEVPKSWQEFVDSKWTDMISVADVRSSAAIHTVFWYLVDYLSQESDAYGWSWFKALDELNPRLVASHGTIRDLVITGERPLGLQVYNNAIRDVMSGEPVSFVYPEEGTPVALTLLGIKKNTANMNAAKAFVDFMVSEEGQRLMVEYIGNVPVRKGITVGDASVLPPIPQGYPLIPVNVEELTADDREEFMRRYTSGEWGD